MESIMPAPSDYGDLRLLDLTAKLSRTRPETVVNVLNALSVVHEHFDMDLVRAVHDLIEQRRNGPPSPENVVACSQAADDIVTTAGFVVPRRRPWPEERARRREERRVV